MKVTGTFRHSDVEGGQWVLETEKGDRYQLEGSAADFKDGARAELTGEIDRNRMSFGMMGVHFVVKKVQLL
jgi:Protein of unknown function (DUF5818)